MADHMIGTSSGRFWLLYFQPIPEVGERIVAGLIFADHEGRPIVRFDRNFPKLRKVFPDVDPATLSFYIDSLAAQLRADRPFRETVDSFGPQLVPSEERLVASPLTEATISLLARKYLSIEKTEQPERRGRQDPVATELVSFVHEHIQAGRHQIKTRVRAMDVLGRTIAGTRRIALAIGEPGRWTLIDGVDLNRATPSEVTKRAAAVSRTFWKYERAMADTAMAGVSIKKVGLVLNGRSHLTAETREAHDYALHLFENDSDFSIDAAEPEGIAELRALLK